MPNMTGRPGYRTMEMIGGSSAPYLACTPCIPFFVLCFIGLETTNVLDYQGRAGDHFHCTVEPSPGHTRCRLGSHTHTLTFAVPLFACLVSVDFYRNCFNLPSVQWTKPMPEELAEKIFWFTNWK